MQEKASYRFPEDVRAVSEGQFEQLDKLVEKSGFSGENARIAKEVINNKKDEYMGAGLDVPELIKNDLAKVSELVNDWDDDVAAVSVTLDNDPKLKPYTAEDLKPLLEYKKVEIISQALADGDAHEAIKQGFLEAAEEQQTAKQAENETDMWGETESAKSAEQAKTIKAEAETIAEPAAEAAPEVSKQREAKDEDWEEAMNVDPEDVGIKGGVEAINKYKKVTRPSLGRRIRDFFRGKPQVQEEVNEEKRAAK